MKPDLDKYIEGNISQEEFERISKQLIKAKFDRDNRKIWAQELKEKYGVERTAAPKKKLFYKLSIAASFLVLLAVSIYFIHSSSSNPVDISVKKLTILNDPTKGSDTKTNKEKAIEYYNNKQFDKSITIWQQMIASGEAGINDYHDLALCYLQKPSPEPEQAIKILKEIQLLNGPKQEIAWLLSLAYLKDGQKEKGIEILSEIVDKKMYKSKEAKKLLDFLSE